MNKKTRRKKWQPVATEKVIKTQYWKYVLGIYDHAQYGQRCFRISKYIRKNDYFIGHFVVVQSDQNKVLPAIAELIQSLIDEEDKLIVRAQQERVKNLQSKQLCLENMYTNQSGKNSK